MPEIWWPFGLVGNLVLIVVGAILASLLLPRVQEWIRRYKNTQAKIRGQINDLLTDLRSQLSKRNKPLQVVRLAWLQLRYFRFALVAFTLITVVSVEFLHSLRMENQRQSLEYAEQLAEVSSHLEYVEEMENDLWVRTVFVVENALQDQDSPITNDLKLQAEELDAELEGYITGIAAENEELKAELEGLRKKFDIEQVRLDLGMLAKNYAEAMCSKNAVIESGKVKDDERASFRLTLTSYQSCMLKEGWITQQCSREEEDCIKLVYFQSNCTIKAREWLDGEGDFADIKDCLVP